MASAPENRPHDYRGAMQRYSSVFPVGGASPSLVNNDLVAGATHSHNQTPLVQATCAKCKASLGALLNSWIPVTNTYYLQSQTSYRATGLEVKGEPKPPGNADSALSGWYVPTLSGVLSAICKCMNTNTKQFDPSTHVYHGHMSRSLGLYMRASTREQIDFPQPPVFQALQDPPYLPDDEEDCRTKYRKGQPWYNDRSPRYETCIPSASNVG